MWHLVSSPALGMWVSGTMPSFDLPPMLWNDLVFDVTSSHWDGVLYCHEIHLLFYCTLV